MNNKNEVFEYLIDQLRHQVNNNQCEDLAHEVQSLKNQLRDALALVAELQKGVDIPSKADQNVNTAAWKLYDALTAKGQINGAQFNILKVAFYDAMLTALGKDGGDKAYVERETLRHLEQSGCRKEDTQARESWTECDGYGACPVPDDTVVDIKFRSGEVESNTKALWWRWGATGGLYDIVAYRVVKQQRRKEDTQECDHDWYFYDKGASMMCKKCGLKK